MKQQARSITTNQLGVHKNLQKVVTRQLGNDSQRPLTDHTKQAYQEAVTWLGNWQGDLILDSCCGVGESTVNIAKAHPNARIIGIDKSALRTNKHQAYASDEQNYLVLRADLNDFLRLLILDGKKLSKHFLLYPNPYPKSAHLQRRWYATSALKDILKLGGILEVRSNWQLYIQEFAAALDIALVNNHIKLYKSAYAITPFERKYWESGQDSWQLLADLNQK
ncbi:SAM-dependent methyltransferase [uncultured Paraglaciecola sp.]|uniref:tRNA (guanine(46)-N(7))-methyltransferase TrmB n=1 Tax=uncultured Paraglaciecola sp. TaxID=1765024 RepID=UPI00262BE12D|nr:SAM-dependent methyltransferase [uncultured Paraglaciecola sp.]